MSWEPILVDTAQAPSELAPKLEALLAHQRQHWPALREAESGLARLRTSELRCDGARIVVQANPGRRRSVLARVDADSVAKRACFLCPENMPPEERGLAFGGYIVLPNPYPVLAGHCTIPLREHLPQRLAGRLGDMLALAAALGPELIVLYNGPRCGASAPDHLHFQACPVAGVPLFEALPLCGRDGDRMAWESAGRRAILAEDAGADDARAQLERTLTALAAPQDGDDEPMVSLFVHAAAGRFRSVLFPRRAHRPARFFAPEEQRLSVSPAALEMAGLLVVAEPEHFERIDCTVARAIYQEVCLEASRFDALAEAVT